MKKTLQSIVLIASLLIAAPSFSETTTRVRKTTVTTVETEGEGDAAPPKDALKDAPAEAVDGRERESVITAHFGSKASTGTGGCKTEELAKGVIRDLKGDCNAWIKDQKSDLKSRYLTSSCQENCEDCGMSLKRCSVSGTVRYLLK